MKPDKLYKRWVAIDVCGSLRPIKVEGFLFNLFPYEGGYHSFYVPEFDISVPLESVCKTKKEAMVVASRASMKAEVEAKQRKLKEAEWELQCFEERLQKEGFWWCE